MNIVETTTIHRRTVNADVQPAMRKCVRCGKLLPLNEFAVDKRRRDGKASMCRECDNKRRRALPALIESKMKICTHCGKLLPFSEFYNDANRKDGKAPECKECFKIRIREYDARKCAAKKISKLPAVIPVQQKECSECGRLLPRSMFYNCSLTSDGKRSKCKDCTKRQANRLNQMKIDNIVSTATANIKNISNASIEDIVEELRKRGFSGELSCTRKIIV